MKRLLLTMVMTGAALGGTIVQHPDAVSQQQPQEQLHRQYAVTSGSALNSQNSPVALSPDSTHSSQVSSNVHYYPSYPEYGEAGYAVQSGYEGYLVPKPPQNQQSSAGLTSAILSSLAPVSRFALTYGSRAAFYLLNFLLLLLLGGALTTSICTFTPFCTISFLGLGLTRNQVREQVKELARAYITPERVSAATSFVTTAINKYSKMQHEKSEGEKLAQEMDSRNKTDSTKDQ